MIQFFTRKKNGAISIMLAIVLIPMLAFGSILMEAARIHSARALLSEMVDNGVFALLAMYDEDLLSRFGLLALDPDVSVEEMDKYLMEAANEFIEDPTNLEKILQIRESDIEAEKLFALNDKEVLSRQIMEYMKYRGPVSLGASALDLDGIIDDLNDALGNALPFLEQMNSVAGTVGDILTTVNSVWEYGNKATEFQGLISSYDQAYTTYASSLESLISYKASEPEKPEKPQKTEGMSSDEYKGLLAQYQEDLEEYRKLVKEFNEEMEEYVTDFNQAKSGYIGAIQSLQSGMDSYLSAHEGVKDAIGSFDGCITDFQKEQKKIENDYDKMSEDEKETFKKVSGTIEESHGYLQDTWDVMSDGFASINETVYDGYDQKLSEARSQAESLTADSITKDSNVDELAGNNYISPIQMLCPMDIVSEVIGQVTSFFEEFVETLGLIVKLIRLIAFFVSGPSTFDLQYITTIESNFASGLPSRDEMKGEESEFREDDRLLVNQELDKTREVAGEIGYNVDDLPVSENYGNGNDSLENKIEAFMGQLQMFLTACNSLKDDDTNIIEKLVTVIDIIFQLVELIGSLIDIVGLIIRNIAQIIYQSVLLNTYITGTFSDRSNADDFSKYSDYRSSPETVTEVDNLFGNFNRNMIYFESFFGLGKKDIAFSGAEVEYILYGNVSEEKNQTYVFYEIMLYRLLLNIVPVLLDDTVTQAMAASGPFCPLVYILWLVLETYVDMQMLTLMEDSVPFIKFEGIYLSMDGIDKLLNKLGSFNTMTEKDKIIKDAVNDISKDVKGAMDFSESDTDKNESATDQNKDAGNTDQNKSENSTDQTQNENSTDQTQNGSGTDQNKNESERTEKQKNKTKEFLEKTKDSFIENITDWKYSRYLWFMLIWRSSDTKLKRTADLIQMEMSKKRESDGESGHFMVDEAFTYIRADVQAETIPLLPIPTVPGANDHGLKLEKIYYGGY